MAQIFVDSKENFEDGSSMVKATFTLNKFDQDFERELREFISNWNDLHYNDDSKGFHFRLGDWFEIHIKGLFKKS